MKKKYEAQYEWKKRNREKVNEIARIWRKVNPDKMAEYRDRETPKSKKKRNDRNNARQKRLRKEDPESVREKDRAYYQANPWIFAPGRQSVEMRAVIATLTGSKPQRGTNLADLYDLMVSAIRKKPVLAVKKFPHGKPDATQSKVEWKFGFDRLRGCQFVWNVLNGFDCMVRWAPSCDDFEKAIENKKNKNILFKSYRDFVIWGYGINNERTNKATPSKIK